MTVREMKCVFGFHDWRYFSMSPTFLLKFPGFIEVGRACQLCRRLEYQHENKQQWNRGAYGVLGIAYINEMENNHV